jgi:hypothetical protein
MRRLCVLFLMMSALSIFISQPNACSEPSQTYVIDTLNLLVAKTLDAYNVENHVEFYRYFACKMEPITRSHHFKKVYIDIYKKELGRILEWELLEKESYFDPDFPVLAYQCKFEKNPCVFMTINFEKEDGSYMITQIRFDKIMY